MKPEEAIKYLAEQNSEKNRIMLAMNVLITQLYRLLIHSGQVDIETITSVVEQCKARATDNAAEQAIFDALLITLEQDATPDAANNPTHLRMVRPDDAPEG